MDLRPQTYNAEELKARALCRCRKAMIRVFCCGAVLGFILRVLANYYWEITNGVIPAVRFWETIPLWALVTVCCCGIATTNEVEW